MLKFALLSLMIDEERSGYELSQLFDHSVGNFWHARHSQIYPTVKTLEADGLVTSRAVAQSGKPDKVLYAATEHGRNELIDWIEQTSEPTVPKMDFSIRAFNLGLLEPDAAIALLREQRRHHQTRLEQLQTIPTVMPEPDLGRRAPFNARSGWRYTYELGVRYQQMWIDWCNDIIDRIEHSTT